MKIAYVHKSFRGKTLERLERAEHIIDEYARQGFALTVRQIYYQFVARGWLVNSQNSYKALAKNLSDGRLAGVIDWNAIVDRTRFVRELPSWDDPQGILHSAGTSYHNNFWRNQEYRPEVWIEKDALVGVFERACDKYDVPLLSQRGYPSQTIVHQAAQRYKHWIREGQQVTVLQFTDHDPSGIDMTRDLEDRLEMFLGRHMYSLTVKRMALTMDQIDELNPPPNFAKLSDARAREYIWQYGEHSWELDALSPTYLSGLVSGEAEALRDLDQWNTDYENQETDRRNIFTVADTWDEVIA